VDYADHFTRLEQCLGLGLVAAIGYATEDGLGFTIRDGCRLVSGTTNESEYTRSVLDQVPGPFVHFHVNQHVAGKELAFALALLAGTHLDDFLGGNQDVTELVFHSGQLDALLQRAHYVLFKPGIGMYDVPTLGHGTPLANELRNNPTQQGIEPPQNQGHDQHNCNNNEGRLSGFRTIGPDHLADFYARLFQQRPECLALYGLQCNEACNQTERNQRHGTIQDRFSSKIVITGHSNENNCRYDDPLENVQAVIGRVCPGAHLS